MDKKLILKKDLIIPAGTEFIGIIAGMKRSYGTGIYEATIGTSKDTFISIVAVEEDEVLFEVK